MNTIENRLSLLEKKVYKHKRLNVLLLGALALIIIFSFTQKGVLEDLRVKSLSVVDDNGRVYATLARDENGGFIGIKNTSGINVFYAGVDKSGNGNSQIGSYNGYKRQETGIGTNGGYASIFNASGTLTASLYNDNDLAGTISTYNTTGTELIYLGKSNIGDGGLWIHNRNGNRTVFLGGDKGALHLNNFYGQNRVWLLSNEWGNGALNLYNSNGNRVIYLGGGDSDKKGYLYTMDGYNTTGVFPR